jgi:hypothetical protein
MLVEIAFGIEPPASIASRYGYDATSYAELEHQTWFQKALGEKQAELNSQGWNFKAKMGMLAEDLLTDAYVAAKAAESAAIKLEVAKYLTKVADLEPKQSLNVAPGGGFMININMGSSANAASKDVIDVVAGSFDDLPPIPDYGVASFPLTTDLIGLSA